jgi:hypothetical protein
MQLHNVFTMTGKMESQGGYEGNVRPNFEHVGSACRGAKSHTKATNQHFKLLEVCRSIKVYRGKVNKPLHKSGFKAPCISPLAPSCGYVMKPCPMQ